MFGRTCKFAVCVAASIGVLASGTMAEAGAYESKVQGMFLNKLRNLDGGGLSEEYAQETADCLAAFAVEGFSPEELRQLNDFATSARAPDESLMTRALDRLTDPEAAKRCGHHD